MTSYFDGHESIYNRFGEDDEGILKVLANRYIGANPEVPFTFRVFHSSGVLQTEDGLYDLNLLPKLPDAQAGQYAYGYALVWSDSERNMDLVLNPLGPIRLFFNRELIYRSNVIDEIKPDAKVKLNLDFRKGWNKLLVQAKKTTSGFGCYMGADEAKVRILNVLSPFGDRKGQSGWIYSEPTYDDLADRLIRMEPFDSEWDSGLVWFPKMAWDKKEAQGAYACERLFGLLPGQHAYAWSALNIPAAGGNASCVLEGITAGPLRIWVGDRLVVDMLEAGTFRQEIVLSGGKHQVGVKSTCGETHWGFELGASVAGSEDAFSQPHVVHGTEAVWFYLGPFSVGQVELAPQELFTVERMFNGGSDKEGRLIQRYWQLDGPAARIRPYYENAMLSNKWTTSGLTNFARWDYPLGVTMYGLLQAGRLLERQDVIEYAVAHIRACTAMYEYSLWDRQVYGFPSINQQLVLIKMLDNCGSFGSAMLEAYPECGDESFLRIAQDIADFMTHELERKPDGAFYRKCMGQYSENTMWADDLYMSTPFLKRFASITGDDRYKEEAVKQFHLFKQYLYMSGQQIMSHVFDFKYGVPTEIPWGRGNGWTIFSLSEFLESLPEDHTEKPLLLELYNQLCAGYIALQAESGLWRQILNEPDAYEEASCTAMFTYAFARGVRFGWLREPGLYAAAAMKGWRGLTRISIDRHGNVHGVCSGSRYSFASDYYMYDLLTVTNDNHGIGIMLLAAVEILKLKHSLG
ncbi:glycoside hydrolase family 105 protein [Cohnella sp.]|uniref:glycoside hydrolase family 88/105 protein n=1 Tax=Cohnella sp. TaxID=1883426 RepID=UPI00356780D1